jgi:hypothetical protein
LYGDCRSNAQEKFSASAHAQNRAHNRFLFDATPISGVVSSCGQGKIFQGPAIEQENENLGRK